MFFYFLVHFFFTSCNIVIESMVKINNIRQNMFLGNLIITNRLLYVVEMEK